MNQDVFKLTSLYLNNIDVLNLSLMDKYTLESKLYLKNIKYNIQSNYYDFYNIIIDNSKLSTSNLSNIIKLKINKVENFNINEIPISVDYLKLNLKHRNICDKDIYIPNNIKKLSLYLDKYYYFQYGSDRDKYKIQPNIYLNNQLEYLKINGPIDCSLDFSNYNYLKKLELNLRVKQNCILPDDLKEFILIINYYNKKILHTNLNINVMVTGIKCYMTIFFENIKLINNYKNIKTLKLWTEESNNSNIYNFRQLNIDKLKTFVLNFKEIRQPYKTYYNITLPDNIEKVYINFTRKNLKIRLKNINNIEHLIINSKYLIEIYVDNFNVLDKLKYKKFPLKYTLFVK